MTSLTHDDDPAWTAIRVSARWADVRRSIESGSRLRVAEGRLLWLMRDGEARTLRQVAEALDLEQSTVNRQVHAALDSGTLRRFRPDGGSAYLLEVTDLGWRRLQADLEDQFRRHRRALAAIPEEERSRFLDRLADYVDALGEAPGTSAG